MDWSKSKNILIIALIATNIFLLFTYITKNSQESSATNQEVLFTVLEGRNIFVDIELPVKYDKMPAITIAYNNDKDGLIEENLRSSKYSVSKDAGDKDYQRAAEKFLKDCELNSENLIFDSVTQEESTVIVRYRNYYKESMIGDSFVDITFDKGILTDITRQFLTPVEQSKKKLNVISPEEALLIFMSEKETNEEVHVEDMKLVFWVNDSSFDEDALVSDTAFPAWQITYNGGLTTYIDAYKT